MSKGITTFVLKYRLPSDEIVIDKSIGDDERVFVQHNLLFYEALQHSKVKPEFNILQNGDHGFALEHDNSHYLQTLHFYLQHFKL